MTTSADAGRAGLRLFCSYAHEDQALLEEMRRHLSVLERGGLISGWDDRMITAGADWEGSILEALEGADVILLLISADFLASDYCWDVEMRRALVRAAAAEALVVPVILRPCDWMGAPFARLQGLPSKGLPVVSWSPRDAGFLDVAEGLRRALQARAVRAAAADRPSPRVPAGELSEARVMDGAIGRVVPVGRATDVVAMVRMPDSGGLRAVLETETSYSPEPGDVRAADFEMDFPVGPAGRPEKVEVVLRLEGSDFEPVSQEKTIVVRPGEDSRTCVFLVTPVHAGPLVLNLELVRDGVSRVQQLLRTNGSLGVERRAMPAYVVHSAAVPRAPAPGAATAGRPPSAPMPSGSGHGGEDPSDVTLAPAPAPSPSPHPPSAAVPAASGSAGPSKGCAGMLAGALAIALAAAAVLSFALR